MICQEIDISKIMVKFDNEEEVSDDYRMDELASSIQQYGLLNPILVRTRKDGRYDLLAGKRRLLACKMLGWEKIPAIIRDDLKEEEARAISLTENLQRAEPAPIIIARNLKKLYDQYHDVKKLAEILVLDSEIIEKYLALLNLRPEFQEWLTNRLFPTFTDTLALLGQKVSSPDEQKKVWEYILGFNPLLQMELIEEYVNDPKNIGNLCDDMIIRNFNIQYCASLEDCGHLPGTYKRLFVDLLELARFKKNFDLILADWIRQMEKSK